ncbi:MAG: hypothetical protein IPK17_00645 [Chloroflexi bacterium]|uniref:hypothetical protein n=1 Tax=Candidatus Flexifilum breve TaxID=3140694 RepID=UPI0031375423|nr:hypothetical protein [Chloroflexota bacterium]
MAAWVSEEGVAAPVGRIVGTAPGRRSFFDHAHHLVERGARGVGIKREGAAIFIPVVAAILQNPRKEAEGDRVGVGEVIPGTLIRPLSPVCAKALASLIKASQSVHAGG